MKIHKIALPESQNLNKNFNFRGHISTFRAKNTPKNWLIQTKNNVQTTPKKLLNNFQKPQKTTFLTPKMSKMTLSKGQFLTKNFDFRGQISTFRAENTPKSMAFKA